MTLRQWLKNLLKGRKERCRYNAEDSDNRGCDPDDVEDNETDLLLTTDTI